MSQARLEEKSLDSDRGFADVRVGSVVEDNGGAGIKYEIVRKLGWGASSTVWLGRSRSEERDAYVLCVSFLAHSVVTTDS